MEEEDNFEEKQDYEGGYTLEFGCCFPNECLMVGWHMRCECHTIEMLLAIEN